MPHVIVIPARLASERLPGKVLLDATGWPLIRHVYERCTCVPGVDRVVVATDGEQVLEVVRGFGAEGVLTDADLASGTDRVAVAAQCLALDPDRDLVVNVQGDEPRIEPSHVEQLFAMLEGLEDLGVATLAAPRRDRAAFENPNRVKVVLDNAGFALYFSRATIPFHRGGFDDRRGTEGEKQVNLGDPGQARDISPWLYHIGTYGFRPAALERFRRAPPAPLEVRERLEQLRFLEIGLRVRVGLVTSAAAGIDTPEDYEEFVAEVRGGGERPRTSNEMGTGE